MEKKQYHSPAMRVVKMQVQHMLAGSIKSVSNNVNMLFGGSSSNDTSGQGARSNGRRDTWNSGWE